MLTRTIMHVDMNAFFAAVEQQANPSLQGKPVVVCGDNSRTVVLTASYEARSYGVKTGMTPRDAKALCPGLKIIPADNRKYTDTCSRLVAIYERFTPRVELFSIDEAFLDITASLRLFGGAETIARSIKQRIRKEMGLTCSIGIAPNKLLAKLGSDLQKPDGLVIIREADVPSALKDLPVKELCGIGDRLEQNLAQMGIRTCGELRQTSAQTLMARFGVLGKRLHQMGSGIDPSPVLPAEEQPQTKSIGHSMTLPQDILDRQRIELHLLQLAEMVGRRLRRHHSAGRTLTLTLRYDNFKTFSRHLTINNYLCHDQDLFMHSKRILDSVRLTQPIRLLGISVSNLIQKSPQLSLFQGNQRRVALLQAMDTLNDRYGETIITWGTLLNRYNHRKVISPAWRPYGSRYY